MMRMRVRVEGCMVGVSFELLCYDIGVELFGGAIAAQDMPKACDCRKFKTRVHGRYSTLYIR